MEKIIEVKNLSKSFGEIMAVNDVSFDVRKGSLFAFLGPNGAGKSTTINMMTTLLPKDNGEIIIHGSTDGNSIRKSVGIVFQNNILDELLTVEENLIFRGSLYIKNKKDVRKRYEELRDYLDFKDFEKQKFKTLSGGQKRRIEIARALFSKPQILFLDEPTTGLDPETRKTVWKTIQNLQKEEGITIFLTTHYMEEAAIADHVVIINSGKIVAQGTPSNLKAKYSYDRLIIVPNNKKDLENYLLTINKEYFRVSDQYIMKISDAKEAILIIENQKENIKNFEVIQGSMDDVFINVIGGEHYD